MSTVGPADWFFVEPGATHATVVAPDADGRYGLYAYIAEKTRSPRLTYKDGVDLSVTSGDQVFLPPSDQPGSAEVLVQVPVVAGRDYSLNARNTTKQTVKVKFGWVRLSWS